jgi:2-polyprenyl-6-methoxyphenol hydroxylase-like FAD-dependent oxidoreductase
MIFVAGAVAGGVVGLILGALLQRRGAGPSVLESRSFATGIAVLALVVAAVALAASARDRDHDIAPVVTSAATTTTTSMPTPTTPTTPPKVASGLVTVPNVSRPALSRKDAEAILNDAHLEVSVETLQLANVPPGFVISQNPLPGSKVKAGSAVTLVVSSVA